MKFSEIKDKQRCEIAYLYLLCNLQLFKQRVEKITLYRKKNDKGRYVSSITCYLADKENNLHTIFFRLYDDDYLWFLCAVQEDFSDTEFEDLTPEEFKIVKVKGGVKDDFQASEEA